MFIVYNSLSDSQICISVTIYYRVENIESREYQKPEADDSLLLSLANVRLDAIFKNGSRCMSPQALLNTVKHFLTISFVSVGDIFLSSSLNASEADS